MCVMCESMCVCVMCESMWCKPHQSHQVRYTKPEETMYHVVFEFSNPFTCVHSTTLYSNSLIRLPVCMLYSNSLIRLPVCIRIL